MPLTTFSLTCKDVYNIITADLNPEEMTHFDSEYTRSLWDRDNIIEQSLGGIILSSYVLHALHRATELVCPSASKLLLLSKIEHQRLIRKEVDPGIKEVRDAVVRSTNPKVSHLITPAAPFISRKDDTNIRKEMRKHHLTGCGLYRYGCTGDCKRCATLFYSVPLTKCSDKHAGPQCLVGGLYPHLTKASWSKLHSARTLPKQYQIAGIMANPLLHERGAIYARLVKIKDRISLFRESSTTEDSSDKSEPIHEPELPSLPEESRDHQMDLESIQPAVSPSPDYVEFPLVKTQEAYEIANQTAFSYLANKRSKKKRKAASSSSKFSDDVVDLPTPGRHDAVSDLKLRKQLDDLYAIIERSKHRDTLGIAVIQYMRTCCANNVEMHLLPEDLKQDVFPDLAD